MKTIIFTLILFCTTNIGFSQNQNNKSWDDALTETCLKKFLNIDDNSTIKDFSIAVAHGINIKTFPYSSEITCQDVLKNIQAYLKSVDSDYQINVLIGDLTYQLNGEYLKKNNFIIEIEQSNLLTSK